MTFQPVKVPQSRFRSEVDEVVGIVDPSDVQTKELLEQLAAASWLKSRFVDSDVSRTRGR